MIKHQPTPNGFQHAPAVRFEAQRLRDLYSLKVLDTSAEERFDRYTELAADLFEVPIALVSLVDEHRQWFKAARGVEQRETERSISLCGHVVAADEPLVIPDALRDPRFAGNPLVDGEPRIRFYAGIPLHGPTGAPVGSFCIIDHEPRQLTERQLGLLRQLAGLVESELQQQYKIEQLRRDIERNAYYDPLTSLPNRRLLTDRLEYALQLAGERQQRVVVALLDINSFGTFNRVYGRETGDELLRAIASRLSREFPPPYVVGRWRDDHFMLMEFGDNEADAPLGERILRCLATPFQVGERSLSVSAKVGVSVYPDDAQDAHDLIQHAIVAMRAKRLLADSTLTLYTPSLEIGRTRRYNLLRRLRRAVSDDQLAVAFQPEMGVRSGRLVGAEALLRWTDPELGPVSAAEAAELAEQTSTIHALGERVLRTACREAARWRRSDGTRLELAVNLTAAQLHRPDLVNLVIDVLNEASLAGEQLVLEVTERSVVEDVDTVVDRMQALRPLGVRFAIDDFGTGYSSFAYLAQLPVSRLKIDRSFVTAINDGAEAAKVVAGIVELAHGLRLDVVAEGVENAGQLALLQEIGCDLIQGYYYSPPLAPDEFLRFMESH